MLKKLYIGTNTKMFKTASETVEFLKTLCNLTSDISEEILELFVIPSFTSLDKARGIVEGSHIKLGAQNISWEERGAVHW